MADTRAASVATEFLDLLSKQQNVETARGRAADVRIVAGNAHYAKLIGLCAIGQARYATTDASQHAGYVVTDPPATPVSPQTKRPGGRKPKQGTPWGALFWFWWLPQTRASFYS